MNETRLPTSDDANLMLRLYELRREEKMRAARAWFVASFKPRNLAEYNALAPAGSEPNAHFRQVASYWEMAASFVNSGVLHAELFMQNSLECYIVWLRVEPFLADLRTLNKNPGQFKNLEKIAASFGDYLERQGAGAAAAFASRFRA